MSKLCQERKLKAKKEREEMERVKNSPDNKEKEEPKDEDPNKIETVADIHEPIDEQKGDESPEKLENTREIDETREKKNLENRDTQYYLELEEASTRELERKIQTLIEFNFTDMKENNNENKNENGIENKTEGEEKPTVGAKPKIIGNVAVEPLIKESFANHLAMMNKQTNAMLACATAMERTTDKLNDLMKESMKMVQMLCNFTDKELEAKRDRAKKSEVTPISVHSSQKRPLENAEMENENGKKAKFDEGQESRVKELESMRKSIEEKDWKLRGRTSNMTQTSKQTESTQGAEAEKIGVIDVRDLDTGNNSALERKGHVGLL
ncbi:hypothetical protein KQX54_011261 [Cotesia glomerata]|uniref:Uncharacterized protein n=1 Tax=Cotesia glomerata TaxID=32391 RepID=A0AAV7IA36_COTGL|nr:hypothetical protein KQX54_011261 [Cotesia glomerata]